MYDTDHPKEKGEISQAIILARLIETGFTVLTPFGDNKRYDYALDLNGTFIRIQCKTASIVDGAAEFNTCSTTCHTNAGGRQTYKGQADYFMAYCPENKKIYVIKVDDCPDTMVRLRIKPAANGQIKGIRFAENYEFSTDSFGSVVERQTQRT